MSTAHRLIKEVPVSDLFSSILAPQGISEFAIEARTNASKSDYSVRGLTDGENKVMFYILKETASGFDCMGNGRKIIDAVCNTFGCLVYTEHDPEFWGFANQEEWDAEEERHAKANK